MRVAAVQFKATKGDLVGSRDRLVALARHAAVDSDLVVLPEMAATGYVFPDRASAAAVAEAPDGATFRALSAVAAEAGCFVVCGFPELAGEQLFNSSLVVDPRGDLAFVYRKTLLFEADAIWAEPGDSGYRRFRTPAGTFGVGICMDLNDPRFLMWLWRRPLDVLAFPTNWVDEGIDVWPYWTARVAGTGVTLVAANTWGNEDAYSFSGRSVILRRGMVLAGADREGDEVLRAVVVPPSP